MPGYNNWTRDWRKWPRPLPTSPGGYADMKLTQRHRNCLAAVIGGTAAVGASLGDVVSAVGQTDRLITEREVRDALRDLLALHLVEYSGLDRTRYVPTPGGIRISEG